jgi:hypothetical protein
MMSPLDDWITKQNIVDLQHKLADPNFHGDRAEVQRRLVELSRQLTPPRGPLFRR